MRLDIGSGGKSALGGEWLGVDAYAPNADMKAYMHCLPVEDDSVEEVYSSHALEHVGIREVEPVLREWCRVLKPGGRLTLLVPDLEWCVIQWLANPTRGFEMERIFGNQRAPGEVHQTGFNALMITKMLTEAGFKVLSVEYIWDHANQTIRVFAQKSPQEEENHD